MRDASSSVRCMHQSISGALACLYSSFQSMHNLVHRRHGYRCMAEMIIARDRDGLGSRSITGQAEDQGEFTTIYMQVPDDYICALARSYMVRRSFDRDQLVELPMYRCGPRERHTSLLWALQNSLAFRLYVHGGPREAFANCCQKTCHLIPTSINNTNTSLFRPRRLFLD